MSKSATGRALSAGETALLARIQSHLSGMYRAHLSHIDADLAYRLAQLGLLERDYHQGQSGAGLRTYLTYTLTSQGEQALASGIVPAGARITPAADAHRMRRGY